VDRAPVCHLGDPGFKPLPGQNSSMINDFVETHTICAPFHAPVSKLGRETPSRIRAWSLIHNKTTKKLFEKTAIRGQRPLHLHGDADHPS
jgi:hypothetical protein